MRVLAEPPLNQWRLGAPTGDTSARDALLGSAPGSNSSRPLVGTGHQPWLWHPGILAKDISAAVKAQRSGAGVFHLIVDQDVHAALRLELPVLEGDRLRIEALHLAPESAAVPTACQPPVDADVVRRNLDATRDRLGKRLRADLGPLIAAFSDLPPSASLAGQIGVVTQRLMEPWTGRLPLVFASELGAIPAFAEVVRQMLRDARHCVACYNRAVARHPDARVAPLGEELDRVELPLWALHRRQPRRRLFADLSDTAPALALENGELYEPAGSPTPAMAPRALLMTAFLRRYCCDLFIHGKGGGAYDRIAEEWWAEWTGSALAPMAVVSADLHLPLDAPVADRAGRDRAAWWVHHLPHNVDRALAEKGAQDTGAEREQLARKRELLAHMGDDRDRRRRAEAFAELHRINEGLAAAHPALLDEAARQLELAKAGLANRAIAEKRDWCFALYPNEQLAALKAAIEDGLSVQSRTL